MFSLVKCIHNDQVGDLYVSLYFDLRESCADQRLTVCTFESILSPGDSLVLYLFRLLPTKHFDNHLSISP